MDRAAVAAGPDAYEVCGNRVWTRHGPVLSWHVRVDGRDFRAAPTYLRGGGYWLNGKGAGGLDACHDVPLPSWHALEREVDRILGR